MGARPGLQLGDELGPAAHEPEHSRQRHELSERNEMDFIIPIHDPLIGDEERGVAEAAVHGVDAAEEHRHPQLGRGRPEALDQRGVPRQNRRRRRLGPDDQHGMLLSDTPQQREVDAERLARVACLPLERLLDRGLDDRDASHARGRCLAEPDRPEGERGRDEDGRRPHAAERVAPAQHDAAGEGGVHREQHERHAVDAGQLRDLDHAQAQVLRVAERAPGEAAEEVAAQPLRGHPEKRRQGQRQRGRPARGQPRHRPRHRARPESAVGGEQQHGAVDERPRDRAVDLEGVLQPAQQDEEEERPRRPAPEERRPRRADGGDREQRRQRHPRRERPVGAREREGHHEGGRHQDHRVQRDVPESRHVPVASRSARKRGRPAATILSRAAWTSYVTRRSSTRPASTSHTP